MDNGEEDREEREKELGRDGKTKKRRGRRKRYGERKFKEKASEQEMWGKIKT